MRNSDAHAAAAPRPASRSCATCVLPPAISDHSRSRWLGRVESVLQRRTTEASRTATEVVRLLESIDDPTLTLAAEHRRLSVKQQTGEMYEVLRLAEYAIELAGGDSTKGKMMTGSPLTLTSRCGASASCCLGIPGWRSDFEVAVSMGRTAEPITRCAALYFTYIAAAANALLAHDVPAREAEEALTIAEQSGGNVEVGLGKPYLGILLVRMGGGSRATGFQLLEQVRAMAVEKRYNEMVVPLIDIEFAQDERWG